MPVSVVIGGQFGSEGKGKVAHEFAKLHNASAAVRVGGPNSGHTIIDSKGNVFAFQHLPTAAVLPNTLCVIGPGAYIDIGILLREKELAQLSDDRLIIDRNAVIITEEHKQRESELGLTHRIGSTASGTGAAVIDRIARSGELQLAKDSAALNRFTKDTSAILRAHLESDRWIIVEGTQGFGLSLLHSEYYPYATSRDTSAAGFVSEAGLSPLDVSEIVLTLRAHPIRVGGESGPLPNETDWATVTAESGSSVPLLERTTVTKKVRRVAHFDPQVVVRAIAHNRPTHIVLNHLDYVDSTCRKLGRPSSKALTFIRTVETSVGQRIDYVGLSPNGILPRSSFESLTLAS